MKKDVIIKKIKDVVCSSILATWIGIVVGGGVALGFLGVCAMLLH